MPTIYNSDLSKELQQGASLQVSGGIPNQLAEKVVPVMEVNPKLLRRINIVKQISKTASGSSTIYTTPTDKDFYLCTALLSCSSDAANDGTNFYLQCIPDEIGQTTNLIHITKITLSAINQSLVEYFFNPIKIKRNSVIAISHTFTAGVANFSGSITGYTVDNPNA